MRYFQNIARLIRKKRISHPKGYSQSDLSNILGYKNGQFISNVERALCNIPLKMLKKVSDVLDIPSDELKIAILKDQEQTLEYYLEHAEENPKVMSHGRNTKEPLLIDGNHNIAGSRDGRQHGNNDFSQDRDQHKNDNYDYHNEKLKKMA